MLLESVATRRRCRGTPAESGTSIVWPGAICRMYCAVLSSRMIGMSPDGSVCSSSFHGFDSPGGDEAKANPPRSTREGGTPRMVGRSGLHEIQATDILPAFAAHGNKLNLIPHWIGGVGHAQHPSTLHVTGIAEQREIGLQNQSKAARAGAPFAGAGGFTLAHRGNRDQRKCRQRNQADAQNTARRMPAGITHPKASDRSHHNAAG